MTDKQAKRLGSMIRSAREAQDLSLRALQELTGLARTWLLYLEAGRSLEPMPDRVGRVIEVLAIDPAKVDEVSGNYLAQSLPTVRTYFRSKGQATQAELDELERVIAEVQAKYGEHRAQGSPRGPGDAPVGGRS